ncbi:MAG: UDP-N-acetylmuramate--L-alanine ligase, partial [Acidobacteriales bacterium]|nr:UDP-N-acetylmuramate--L-alanine ligase [Terriglobales bacterium]
YGLNLLCGDDERLRTLVPRISRRVLTYGAAQDANFRMQHLGRRGASLQSFSVTHNGKAIGEFDLAVPGVHNALNATAGVAVGVEFDIPADKIASALREFHGVDRRFQRKGSVNGIDIVDDYGHHPTEIKATLAAAQQCGYKRIHVIFQPHRYTRTRDLMQQFATAFDSADSIIVLDVYAASEEPIPGVTGEALASEIAKHHRRVEYCPSFEAAIARAIESASPGDLIMTLGAGNVVQLAPMLIDALGTTATQPS